MKRSGNEKTMQHLWVIGGQGEARGKVGKPLTIESTFKSVDGWKEFE